MKNHFISIQFHGKMAENCIEYFTLVPYYMIPLSTYSKRYFIFDFTGKCLTNVTSYTMNNNEFYNQLIRGFFFSTIRNLLQFCFGFKEVLVGLRCLAFLMSTDLSKLLKTSKFWRDTLPGPPLIIWSTLTIPWVLDLVTQNWINVLRKMRTT